MDGYFFSNLCLLLMLIYFTSLGWSCLQWCSTSVLLVFVVMYWLVRNCWVYVILLRRCVHFSLYLGWNGCLCFSLFLFCQFQSCCFHLMGLLDIGVWILPGVCRVFFCSNAESRNLWSFAIAKFREQNYVVNNFYETCTGDGQARCLSFISVPDCVIWSHYVFGFSLFYWNYYCNLD